MDGKFPARDPQHFQFGLEAEFLLVDADTFHPLLHPQLRFDELKNNLVATVAHEFRTPLTSLRMAIHLCVEQAVGPLTEKQAELLFAAREDCERLQSTVDELLDLSRIQSGRMELRRQPVEVETFVAGAVEGQRSFAAQRGVELRSEVLPGMGEFAWDPERLGLVFANLLGNALKFTRGRAPAIITVGAQAAAEPGGQHEYFVRDNGVGFDPAHVAKLFGVFQRLHDALEFEGTGIGLAIV